MTQLVALAKPIALPHIDYLAILPILVLLGGALVILLWSSLTRRPLDTVWVTSLTVLAAAASLVIGLLQYYDVRDHGAHTTIAHAVVQDGFSAFMTVLVSAAIFVSAIIGDAWLTRERITGPELHVLLLVSGSGAIVMASANDLILVFLGLEILSIALYVLAATNSRRAESGEAALKYFVLGGFSSAIFLYGIALVYGATGTTNLPQLAAYLAHNVLLHNGLLLGGLALLLVGFGFKIAAVPFHQWTPDVYQGSPSPVTGFMASVAKIGAFAALLRVFVSSFGVLRSDWRPAIWVLAAITLVVGAVLAVVQRDVKRMLAYSSINHAGFVLLGVQAATGKGVDSSLYYLFAYSFMVLGSFAVVTVVGGRGDSRHDLQRYRGLAARQPVLAAAFAVLLVAQAGVPFTTGFLAKLNVVEAAVGAHSTDLAVVAMVSAVIAAFFYIRVIVLMYAPLAGRRFALAFAGAGEQGAAAGGGADLGSPEPAPALAAVHAAGAADVAAAGQEVPVAVGADAAGAGPVGEPEHTADLQVPGSIIFALAICVAVTVVFGVIPWPLTAFAHHATLLFRP